MLYFIIQLHSTEPKTSTNISRHDIEARWISTFSLKLKTYLS